MSENTGLPYLGEVIDIHQFKRGQVNIVVAPCHSGKTTAAIKIFKEYKSLSPSGLFLIDTTAGRDSLLSHQPAQRTPYEMAEVLNPYSCAPVANQDRFVTQSYYEFGIRVRSSPEAYACTDLIICDEVHNLVRFLSIEKAQNERLEIDALLLELGFGNQEYASALNYLTEKAVSENKCDPLIIFMTATPRTIYAKLKEMNVPYAVFDYTDKVRCDQTASILYYSNFGSLIENLNERAIIYVPTIKQIQKFSTQADNGQRKIACLWSKHNKDFPMNSQQLEIRNQILQTEQIPPDIDLLFINAAYETSINIRNEDFKTMVIHTGDTDVQTQARGRLRHNIDTLYLYDKEHNHITEYFPKEYYGVPLSASDRKIIAEKIALTNPKGRPLEWPSIAKALKKNGALIEQIRIANQRHYIVFPVGLVA